jgi:hypothetical protein
VERDRAFWRRVIFSAGRAIGDGCAISRFDKK